MLEEVTHGWDDVTGEYQSRTQELFLKHHRINNVGNWEVGADLNDRYCTPHSTNDFILKSSEEFWTFLPQSQHPLPIVSWNISYFQYFQSWQMLPSQRLSQFSLKTRRLQEDWEKLLKQLFKEVAESCSQYSCFFEGTCRGMQGVTLQS